MAKFDRNARGPARERRLSQQLGIETNGGETLAAAHRHVGPETPAGTIDGANGTFTLAAAPAAGLQLFKNGLLQADGAGNDFTIAGATITFLAGNIPQTGDTLRAYYLIAA